MTFNRGLEITADPHPHLLRHASKRASRIAPHPVLSVMGAPLKRSRRRGIQLLEIMFVLPIVGLVLTSVAFSVAGTQRALERLQQQAVELATVDRFAQRLREDVHRATRLPTVSGQTLEIERLEGTVRYEASENRLVRHAERTHGSARDTFAIASGRTPWTVAAEERLVRFARDGGREIVAAWPGSSDATAAEAPTPEAEEPR